MLILFGENIILTFKKMIFSIRWCRWSYKYSNDNYFQSFVLNNVLCVRSFWYLNEEVDVTIQSQNITKEVDVTIRSQNITEEINVTIRSQNITEEVDVTTQISIENLLAKCVWIR